MKKGYVIPIHEKLAYGVGDLAINIGYGSIGFYMLWFIVNVGGVSPAKAGFIFLSARAWDAITDYIMGRISDKTHSRWGRRKPYILFGAIPMGICFALLWYVPGGSEMAKFVYYLIAFILFNTAFTVVAVPYGSLMAEMTQVYDERTSLSGFRLGSSFIGTLIGAAGVSLIVDIVFADLPKADGFFSMGIIFGMVIIGILFITGSSVKERTQITEQNYEGFFTTIASFFKLKEFRITLGMFLFNMIGFDIIMATFFFFINDVIKVEGDATIYMGIPLIVAAGAAPLWIYLGNRWGKKKAYIVSSFYFSTAMLICLFIPEHGTSLTIVLCVLSGIGISATQIIPWSILPDVIEIDEYTNGVRREGSFFGISTFLYKVASAIAIATVGFMLELSGYIKASPDEAIAATQDIIQPDSSVMAIRVLIGVAPGICFLISAVYVWLLPTTKERFNEILKELEIRKAGKV
ncbi:MAG: MFS transporter [Thermodesulfobacteriota bacterium]|nr:MFS transporter [Thermodesulfobacteriota bacterium]